MPWFKNRNFSAVFPDWKKRAVKQYFEKSKKLKKYYISVKIRLSEKSIYVYSFYHKLIYERP